MQQWLLSILIFLPIAISNAATGSFRLLDGTSQAAATVQEQGRTVIDIRIASLDYEQITQGGFEKYQVALPEEFGISRGAFLGADDVLLPTMTRLIAVPFDSDPTFRVIRSSFNTINNISLAQGSPEDIESLTLSTAGRLRGQARELVTAEIAGVMRDLKIYALTISPMTYNPQSLELNVYDDIEIEINHSGAQLTRFDGQISEAFAPIYRSILDNPLLFDPIRVTRGAYWILYPDVYASNIQPLVDWKKAKGFSVETISKTQIGSNSYNGIKTYINNRYDTCLVKPDYIVIVADVTMPNNYGIATKPYSNPNGDGDSDNFYTFLDGDDYFPEIFIGRISIDNISDLVSYIDKAFTYERTPYMADTDWYLRGTVVAGSDGYSFLSPRLTKLWCREIMMDSGYTQVDTFFDDWSGQVSPEMINSSIDGGVSFVNYRGYGNADAWIPPNYSVGDMNHLSNNPMFPIMTSIVCATGDYNDVIDLCFGENWIRATDKGGAGFIGNTNHYAHTRWTNAIDVGIYWGWFAEGVGTLAQGQLMGKVNLYNAFPDNREANGQVDLYFNSYNDLGDPEINIWTGIPRVMTTVHPDSMVLGQNRLDIQVLANGAPLEGAAICAWKGTEVFSVGFSGADGNYEIVAAPQTPGDLRLTITARGYIPIEDTVTYYPAQVSVSYLSHILDDDLNGESNGNGDGLANPSESIELVLGLKNFGSSDTAREVNCHITSESEGVQIIRADAGFGDIAPGDSAFSSAPFLVHIRPDAENGSESRLLLDITDANNHSWQGIVNFRVVAAAMNISAVTIDDHGGNNQIDPGENVDIIVNAQNIGAAEIRNATAVLRCSDRQVRVTDSVAVFGDCAPGAGFDNSADHFAIIVAADIYIGHIINFEIVFSGSGPQVVSAGFNQQVGQISAHDPIGPDDYGYYCFDDSDSLYADYPTINWINIETQWPYVTVSDDDVATVDLPFVVKYYGQDFNQITICDNGFAAFGRTWFTNFFNTPIPAPQNAKAMLAPYWDDFVQSSLRVYHHYDATNGWFVIGWRNAILGDILLPQTFEIVILDEAAWPTITHDNEIIYLYHLVQNPFTCSVGICSPDRRDGIQYVFDNVYNQGAPELTNTRKIKFTTGAPAPGCQYVVGDINNNGVANGLDVVYGVNFLKGGPAPTYECDCPNHGFIFAAGDVNNSCSFNGIDITFMVNYFKGGTVFTPCADCPPSRNLSVPNGKIESLNRHRLNSADIIPKQ